ncbi:MAG: SCO family protein [Pseudomonadota bacterium]|nr:SCO family protein [Pseudomonadota bacterium]
MKRRVAIQAIACSALVTGIFALPACTPNEPKFHALDITGADYAKDFQLTDFHGQPRQLADFAGKAVIVFFGFTQCPDVCPTTMGEMVQLKQALDADGDRLQVLFISIDPERDTPEVLREYMAAFDPSFLGLYAGSADALAALAKQFKVYYKKVPGSTPDTYSMDHTAASYVYDPQGRLRLYVRPGTPTDHLRSDVQQLLKGG